MWTILAIIALGSLVCQIARAAATRTVYDNETQRELDAYYASTD